MYEIYASVMQVEAEPGFISFISHYFYYIQFSLRHGAGYVISIEKSFYLFKYVATHTFMLVTELCEVLPI